MSTRNLLTLPNLIVDGIVSSSHDLRLEIQIDQFSLLGSPLAISIPVEDNLVAASVTDLSCRVAECAVGGPLDLVAGVFLDDEGLAAAGVAVGVKTGFDGVVCYAAGGDGLACVGGELAS